MADNDPKQSLNVSAIQKLVEFISGI